MIVFTPKALERVAQIRADQKIAPELHVRIRVLGGGCAGFVYDMYFDRPRDDDHEAKVGGETILLDARTPTYMTGTVVDVGANGFVFENPQAVVVCKCGASFRAFQA